MLYTYGCLNNEKKKNILNKLSFEKKKLFDERIYYIKLHL